MKIKLPKASQEHQEIIDEITDIIKEKGGRKIAYIILFGSFARGNWVDDFRQESDGSWGSYNSDYDLLVLTKSYQAVVGTRAINLERAITKEIKNRDLLTKGRVASIIIEPLKLVNDNLRKGQYFFSDIVKEGILLYKAQSAKELAEPKELTNEEQKEIAEEYFEDWFRTVEEYLGFCFFGIDKEWYKLAAFNLHQAAESLYNCAHLVFTNYRPRSHNLKELSDLIIPYCKEFNNVLTQNNEEEEKHFSLLNKAYVGRYNKNYKITKEQLYYLIIKVEELKELVKKVCEEKINSFDK